MFFKKEDKFVSESLSDFLFQSDSSIQILFLKQQQSFLLLLNLPFGQGCVGCLCSRQGRGAPFAFLCLCPSRQSLPKWAIYHGSLWALELLTWWLTAPKIVFQRIRRKLPGTLSNLVLEIPECQVDEMGEAGLKRYEVPVIK